ncbi:MAG: glycerol-3-phosphate dehydrogenase/oxidase, partial [Planctomycetaceae bacterium]
RPLIAPRRQAAGAPSDISRRHIIQMTQPGWFDVAGGKLTTYRLMAEQVVDQAGRYLGMRLPRSRTADLPLARGPYSGVLPPAIERGVVEECCRREWAIRLDDVLLRRTSWHYYHPNQTDIIVRTAGWMAENLGWDSSSEAAELERFRAILAAAQDCDEMPRRE